MADISIVYFPESCYAYCIALIAVNLIDAIRPISMLCICLSLNTLITFHAVVSSKLKDEIEGKKTSLLAQMYDRNRILVMLPIMWLNIS